jgi:hypothetical protein
MINSPDKCPNIESHTKSPRGYLEGHKWARDMSKTHNQTRCPDCNLWVIWKPKTK